MTKREGSVGFAVCIFLHGTSVERAESMEKEVCRDPGCERLDRRGGELAVSGWGVGIGRRGTLDTDKRVASNTGVCSHLIGRARITDIKRLDELRNTNKSLLARCTPG